MAKAAVKKLAESTVADGASQIGSVIQLLFSDNVKEVLRAGNMIRFRQC